MGLTRTIEQRPNAAFLIFLILHAAVWTALPAGLYHNLPLDLIEALIYGREWQLGYDKLPPLPWWLVEVTHRLFGPDLFYYLLAEAAVVAAFWLVWLTARPMVGAVGALIAVLIVDGIHYYNYTAAKFNHDVIQLPFWALAGYAFRRALHEDKLAHWAVLGFAVGMALWAKYFVVVLAAPLALFVLLDPQARQSLRRPGPYLALAVALVVAAPHLAWLVQNDFLPLRYVEARASLSRGVLDHMLHPLQFLVSQMFFLAPALLIALPLMLPRGAAPPAPQAFDRRIVTLLAFGPFAAMLALSAISGRGTIAMWGYPLWLFLGLWIVLHARAAIDHVRLGRAVAAWAVIFCVLAGAFIANYAVLPHRDGRYRASLYPGDALAAQVSQGFRAATGEPLKYVIGEMWIGGNVAHYSGLQPQVLIDGDPRRAPWIDLADLRKHGAVVVWQDTDLSKIPRELAAVSAGAIMQPTLDLPFRAATSRRISVGWAILPPAKGQ